MGGRERQSAKGKDVEKGRRRGRVGVELPVCDHSCDYTFSSSAVETIFHTYTHHTYEAHIPAYTTCREKKLL